MRFPFTKEAMPDVPDETLDEIAAEDEARKAALVERARRIEERRLAAEQEARQKVVAEKQATVDRLLAEHTALAAEATKVYGAVGAAVIGLGCALGKRDVVVGEVRRVAADLRGLGAQAPPLSLAFAPEVHAAARVCLRAIEGMVESPLASAERNFPSAFFK